MKRISLYFTLAFSALSLIGCGSYPKSPHEFRQAIQGSDMGTKESVVINRPLNSVAESLRKHDSCFNREVTYSESVDNQTRVYGYRYNTRMHAANGKLEWTLQKEHTKGVLDVVKPPEGGMYLVVVNADALDGKRSRMDLYYGKEMYGIDMGIRVATAVKAWGQGKNAKCPDLSDE